MYLYLFISICLCVCACVCVCISNVCICLHMCLTLSEIVYGSQFVYMCLYDKPRIHLECLAYYSLPITFVAMYSIYLLTI